MLKTFNGALVIREQNDRVFYEAKWRDSRGRQVKRRVGPAWVERDARGAWRRRSGRMPQGCLDEKAAIVEMRRLIDEREDRLAAEPEPTAVTFDHVATDWLHHIEHVDGVTPSTLSSYRYMLRSPRARARKRGRRKAGGRVLAEFGGQPIATITSAQVERWLGRLDTEPISKRTINIHRQPVCSILGHAPAAPTSTASTPTSPRPRPSAASLTPSCWTSTSPRRSPRWRARPAPAHTATRHGPPCPTQSAKSGAGPTTRTPPSSSSPRSPACACASCSSSAGAT